MGDVRRKHNLYSRPKKAFDSARIASEGEIVQKFGLKNKKEIWKAEAKISVIRTRAKLLIPQSQQEKDDFFKRLQATGLKVDSISDALGLKTEDWLERRLQTFVFRSGLVKTPLEARQLIVHKGILVDGKIVNIPSFVVTKKLENKISLKAKKVGAVKDE